LKTSPRRRRRCRYRIRADNQNPAILR
jgi:hypothetical protein